MKQVVMVWGEPVEITVHRKEKTVWTAVGEYLDKHISVEDRTEGAVIKRWRGTAKYHSA